MPLKIPKKQRGKQSVSHARAPMQEEELARRFSGTQVPGSGSGHQKGDVKGCFGIIRIEAKTTKNKSFSVTRDMLRKIDEASMMHDEIPAMVIEFINEDGTPEMEVAVIPTYALQFVSK